MFLISPKSSFCKLFNQLVYAVSARNLFNHSVRTKIWDALLCIVAEKCVNNSGLYQTLTPRGYLMKMLNVPVKHVSSELLFRYVRKTGGYVSVLFFMKAIMQIWQPVRHFTDVNYWLLNCTSCSPKQHGVEWQGADAWVLNTW